MDIVACHGLRGIANHAPALLLRMSSPEPSDPRVGSLLPYYIGRAGGELFLLQRINRERYERLAQPF